MATKTKADIEQENKELLKKLKEAEQALAEQKKEKAELESTIEKRFSDLTSQIEQITKEKDEVVKNAKTSNTEDEYITIQSLSLSKVNLRHRNGVEKLVIPFDEVDVEYNIAREIVRNNKKFFDKGLVTIKDKKIGVKLGLSTKLYDEVLTKEGLEDFFKTDLNKVVDKYKKLHFHQQKTINQFIYDAVFEGKDIDYNVAMLIDNVQKETSNTSIIDNAKHMKKHFETNAKK
jgi:hypothetical protein